MLLDDLRFIIAVAVSGNGQFNIALTANDSFLVAAITAVICLLVLVVVLAVTEFFIKFCIHGFLYQPCSEFFHQRLNTSDILDAPFLDELPHQIYYKSIVILRNAC